jgi:hypothetical protein
MERFDAAVSHFSETLEMNNKQARSPLWVAHTQHDYARMLLRRGNAGDRAHALELLGAALATADELGLRAMADRARRRKRAAGAL